MLVLNALSGFGASSAAALPSLTFLSSFADSTNATTYNTGSWTSVAIGAADANRTILLAIGGTGSNSTTISSVSIAGSTATALATLNDGLVSAGFYALLVPSGTTANFAITFSAGKSRACYAAYSILNLSSLTPLSTVSNSTTSGFPSLGLATTDIDGVSLALSLADGLSGSSPYSWFNGSEDYDINVESTATQFSGTNITPVNATSSSFTFSRGNTASAISNIAIALR